MNKKDLVKHFERLAEFTEPMIDRGIEEHRKGLFGIKVTDKNGKPMSGVKVSAKLNRHEFNLGCEFFCSINFLTKK